MRASPADIAVRIVSMLLAALVSLSLIGAIHTATQGGGPAGSGGFTVETAPTVPSEQAAKEQAELATSASEGVAREGGGGGASAVAVPPRNEESDKWLEVIAYLLLALAGIAALGGLILWRGLARIGAALETLAAREPPR